MSEPRLFLLKTSSQKKNKKQTLHFLGYYFVQVK